LYVFRGVPMDTHFEPKTRKEISKIQWWRISDLPTFHKKGQQQQAEAAINANKFYMVAPFIRSVRKWATEQKNKDSNRATSNQYLLAGISHDELMTEEEQGGDSSVPGPEPSVQNIHQLETALRTALKIQPPTQGLRMDAITAIQSPIKDSGQELLALLQGRPQPSKHVLQSNLPPQTPQDHIATQPPMPGRPHHQQPRPANFQNFPPAPAFPSHLRSELSNQPPQPLRSETFSNQLPASMIAPNERNALSQLNPNYPPHHQPFNAPTFHQGQLHGERHAEWAAKNPHPHQPQHLVHPQPLPPQVQRAVFTGVPAPAPPAPQPNTLPPTSQRNPSTSQMPNPPFSNVHPAPAPSAQKLPPPKLTDHSLALLSAFKSQDQTSRNAGLANTAPLQRQAPPQELPAEVSNAPPVDLLSMFKVQQPEQSSPRTDAKPPADAAHRSSLLNLFKSPPTTSLVPRPNATAFPTSTTPSAVELSAVEPLSSNTVPALISTAEREHVNYRERNSSIPELHPESNLPFRAISILSRPVEASGSGSTSAHETPTNEVRPSADQSTREQLKLTSKPFHPQILKRPQSQTQTPAEPSNPIPSALPTLPAESSFDSRTSQNAEHKQTLLSLFGKAPSPAAPPAHNIAGASFAPPPVTGQGDTPVRTRVGSLASESASRHGSQALSPADKSFLLSYLDNVAKGTHL
jgi:mRNA-decapping enzyme subunit 2